MDDTPITDALPTHGTEETITDDPHLFYPSLNAWVEDWVSTVYLRKDSQQVKWCPQWWNHPEAVVILTALWEAWELQRIGEAGSNATFLVERFYPLMDRLTSANGTFHLCSPHHGHTDSTKMQEPGIMPTEQAPPDIMAIIGGDVDD